MLRNRSLAALLAIRTLSFGAGALRALAFSTIALSTGALAESATATQPNLVLILADDLGWSDLGCYGNAYHETPHIDRLAREGIRWTQAYAGPVCSPTRANLQSGRHEARYGITQHIPGHRRPFAALIDPPVPRQLPLEVETFAERLTAAGYATGYFGKWHLGGKGFGPATQGWETALEFQGNTVPRAIRGDGDAERTAEFLTDRAVEFIEAYAEGPFLLQVSHYAVHIPLSTTPELLDKYRAKPPLPGHPSLPEYAGLLEELDRSVGRIVDAIDRAGIAENTLIVFLSDNGGLEHEQSGRVVTSNVPLRGEKGMLYEGGIRIPAIARWAGRIQPGTVCDTPIATIDWHPTFTALAGASPDPASLDEPPDGLSLVPLLDNPQAELERRPLYWHLPHYHHGTPASAIRDGNWKLIEFFEDGRLELYNLRTDLGEQANLRDRDPERAGRLQAELAAWRKKVGARMPAPNPEYDPNRAGELAKPTKRRNQPANPR